MSPPHSRQYPATGSAPRSSPRRSRSAGRRGRARDRRLRPRWRAATWRRARSSPTRSWRSCAASTPSCSGRSARPRCPPGVLERGLLLRLRFELDLYVNLRPFPRPASVGAGVPRRLRSRAREHRGRLRRRGRLPAEGDARTRWPRRARSTPASASSAASATPSAWAASRRHHLTLVHKTNVLTFAGDLWQRVFNEVGAEYPGGLDRATTTSTRRASTSSSRPTRYDVIVTDNLFGDILTDLAGAVAGGIGCAALGQPEPGPHRPVAVRARARQRPRHRRHGQGQPGRGDRLGGHDARVPGPGRRGGAHHQGVRRLRARRLPLHHQPVRRRDSRKGVTNGAHHQDRVHLDGRRARRLGRRQGARPHPHAPLRQGRVRGHPGLRDAAGRRLCSA